jgi:DNA repair exonuclease SbcCD nuclease subunit
LVSPNIGHPKILNIDSELTKKYFKTNLLIITQIENPKELRELLFDNIKLIPIFDYKWKLEQLLEKRGLRDKVKHLWKKIKSFFSFKKKERGFEISIEELDKFGNKNIRIKKMKKKDLKKLKPRAFRGIPIIAKLKNLISTIPTKIDDSTYIDDQYCKPQNYLRKLKVFGNLEYFYTVTLEFYITDEILAFLSKRDFIMFDIIFENSNFEKKINYHAIFISKNDWKNIIVVQATDLHVAKRNDEMFNKINHMYRNLRNKNIEKINQIENKSPKLKDKNDLRESLYKIDLSFKKRLINPNNLLRKFVKKINKKVINNKIDFLVITGDIVDFTNTSSNESNQNNIFAYQKSNWKIFKDIILNINQINRKGIKNSEEILCPFYSIPGNHDYRPWQYDLNWGGIHKKVGLKKEEAKALKEEYSASPIKAILKSENALKGYLSEINSSLDYYLELNNFLFIFLNTGSDSYKKTIDFLSGSPSLTGLTQKQIKFLYNLIKSKFRKNIQVFLYLHAPPINTREKRGILSRIKKKFKKKIKITLEQFKETKLKRKDEKKRIDKKFNIKYGTISSNWEKLFNFCYDYCTLILSGHTHRFNEYRLEKLLKNRLNHREEKESQIAVFYDDYSKIYKNVKQIEKHKPFIVQTPPLGFKSYKKSSKVGAYREILIKNGKLSSFQVKYI